MGPDPDERLAVLDVLAVQPDVAEHAVREDPVRAGLRFEEVDVVGDDRVRVPLETLRRHRQEAVVATLRAVGPEERAAGREQPGAEERDDAPQHDEQDAPPRPTPVPC